MGFHECAHKLNICDQNEVPNQPNSLITHSLSMLIRIKYKNISSLMMWRVFFPKECTGLNFIKLESNNISVAPQSLHCLLPPELSHPITKQHLELNTQLCNDTTDSGAGRMCTNQSVNLSHNAS